MARKESVKWTQIRLTLPRFFYQSIKCCSEKTSVNTETCIRMDSGPGGALKLALPCPAMITAHWLSPALILGWLEQEYPQLHAGPKDRPQPSSKFLWESLGSSHFKFQICAGNGFKVWGDSTVVKVLAVEVWIPKYVCVHL